MSKTKHPFLPKKTRSECLPSCREHSVNMWKVYIKMFSFETMNFKTEIRADKLKLYTFIAEYYYFSNNKYVSVFFDNPFEFHINDKWVAVLKQFYSRL